MFGSSVSTYKESNKLKMHFLNCRVVHVISILNHGYLKLNLRKKNEASIIVSAKKRNWVRTVSNIQGSGNQPNPVNANTVQIKQANDLISKNSSNYPGSKLAYHLYLHNLNALPTLASAEFLKARYANLGILAREMEENRRTSNDKADARHLSL
jgi:hypothetical protein